MTLSKIHISLLSITLLISCVFLSGCGKDGYSDMNQQGVPYSLPFPEDINRLYYQSQHYYFPPAINFSYYDLTDSSYPNSVIKLIPFVCGKANTIFNGLLINQSAFLQPVIIDFALYSATKEGHPDSLLYNLGSVDLTSDPHNIILEFSNIQLNNDIYFIAMMPHGAVTLRSIPNNLLTYSAGYKISGNDFSPITSFAYDHGGNYVFPTSLALETLIDGVIEIPLIGLRAL